jgi:hypothetical protein
MRVKSIIKSGLFFSFLISGSILFSQSETAEIIFLDSKNLTTVLESIINVENTCHKNKKSIVWYIDYDNEDSILVGQGRIGNLMDAAKVKELELLVTFINQKIVFLFSKKPLKSKYSSSNFYVDLSKYNKENLVLFEDFSVWKVANKESVFTIVDKIAFECN